MRTKLPVNAPARSEALVEALGKAKNRGRKRRRQANGRQLFEAKLGSIRDRERIDFLTDDHNAVIEVSPLAGWDPYYGAVPAAGVVPGLCVVVGVPRSSNATAAPVMLGFVVTGNVMQHARDSGRA